MKIVKDSAARAATLLPEEGEVIAEGLNRALTDVTADPGVDTVTIELPKDEPWPITICEQRRGWVPRRTPQTDSL